MAGSIYSGYRFPRDVIQRAVWMYLRFTLSYRDVEDLLAERGIEVSYETVRRWVFAFAPVIARQLRARRPKPHGRWHLDEMFVRIGGQQMYLWRAVDAEGEVLDVLVQARRDNRRRQEADAQAPEEAWDRSDRVGHGQVPSLWLGAEGTRDGPPGPCDGKAVEQPRRKLTRPG